MYSPLRNKPNLTLLKTEIKIVISNRKMRSKKTYFLGPSVFIVIAVRAKAARSLGGASAISSYFTSLISSEYLP